MPPVKRVAMLSLHTSPLDQPGGGDAGGMNVYVRSLALELARVGIDVEVFTRAASAGQPHSEELGPGVIVRHLRAGPARKLPKEVLPGLSESFADAIADVTDLLTDGHFDVIHSHYWVSGGVGLTVSKAMNLPLIHSMHTMARVKNLRMHQGGSQEPDIRVSGEQDIVAGASRLIANTSTEAAELESLYGASAEKVDIVAPGVDLDTFNPLNRSQSRATLGFAEDVFHVVFAGRIQRLKGPHLLVDAAEDLAARRPDIPLQISIIGSGSGSEALELQPMIDRAGLHETVHLYPPVEALQLARWFRAADVVAMPSFSESFGLVALEAQACGTPVLAANVGGLPQAISNGRTGILVNGHTPELWGAALETMHDGAGLRTALGRGAAVHALAFGWQRTALLTAQSYRTAVELYQPATVR
ncbi:D-inositol-3-phosphate glycosyltransferase [Arthrobacter sp. H5]|uniref:D-inositol-3-phosphate glycosyltransferase n=1 Tax=Arthrobacter sp. H5 TaxID=1267973 RepID=UPI00048554D4|nr:D-inositol-3-phosphate glycosyltransferase [Arthrobacter sp. H5]